MFGNYGVAVLKVSENYEELQAGLEDICSAAKDMEVVTAENQVHRTQFYLGGDFKFLALVYCIESANAVHACVWCKCPKSQHSNMEIQWSITDPIRSARAIEEITEKSKLGKRNKDRYNCKIHHYFLSYPPNRL